MTMAQKILAAHSGRERVEVGELIEVHTDMVLANDITAPIAITEFAKLGIDRVFDPARIALVPDHFAPNKDIKSAEQCKQMRAFARAYGIVNYFEVGRMGIEHALLPELGSRAPGMWWWRGFAPALTAPWRLCYWHGLYRYRRGHGHRPGGCASPRRCIVHHGALRPWVARTSSCTPSGADRRRGRPLPRHRVRRAGHRCPVDGWPLSPWPTWPSRREPRRGCST